MEWARRHGLVAGDSQAATPCSYVMGFKAHISSQHLDFLGADAGLVCPYPPRGCVQCCQKQPNVPVEALRNETEVVRWRLCAAEMMKGTHQKVSFSYTNVWI